MRWTPRFVISLAAGAIIIPAAATAIRALDLGAAKQMFADTCIKCHGPEGLGDGPDGAKLTTKPRNFRDCAFMAKESDETVFNEIKNGSKSIGRSNDMPAWGAALSDEEIHGLVAFVRGFCANK